jgi:hypothetical protein
MVGVLLLSAALLWHDLAVHEVLGRDENLTITKLDQPDLFATYRATTLKATGQPGNMQPLYFLLQRGFWPIVQRSAFVLRFLPSAFALLAVAFVYKLGEALFGPEAGLVGSFLTAMLPLHVRYAQIARPYTLLALLSLASAYFLVRALETNHPRAWAGFVLTATLNFYTHYNALFVLAVQGLFTAFVWLGMFVTGVKKQQSPNRLAGPVIGFLLVGIFCLPGLIRLIQLPWVGERGQVQVELTFAFFHWLLHKFGLTNAWLRGLILGFMGLGLLSALVRRRWWATLFTVLWIALPFLLLSMIKSPRPFAERYVIFVPPVALLLAGEGVSALGQLLNDLVRRLGAAPRWTKGIAARRVALTGLTAVLIALLTGPLLSYYAANRVVDRMDRTLEVVERHAQPGDVIVVSPRFFVRSLRTNGAEILYLTEHLSLTEFDELLSRYQRAWILYSSYLPSPDAQEPLDQWIQARLDDFARVPIKAISAVAYYNGGEEDPEALLRDRIIILQELAAVSEDNQEAWLRHSALADAYEALGGLYDGRGESALAQEFRTRAEETRAAAPRPW